MRAALVTHLVALDPISHPAHWRPCHSAHLQQRLELIIAEAKSKHASIPDTYVSRRLPCNCKTRQAHCGTRRAHLRRPSVLTKSTRNFIDYLQSSRGFFL